MALSNYRAERLRRLMNKIYQNAKEIWLNYFNQVLFEKGLITDKEKNRMNNLIYTNCHTSKDKKLK